MVNARCGAASRLKTADRLAIMAITSAVGAFGARQLVLYTGQGSNEFGHAPGAAPPSPHASGGVSSEKLAMDSAKVGLNIFFGFSMNDGSLRRRPNFGFIGDLISLFRDLLGGGPSLPTPPPRDYKGSHAPECGFMGVLSLCADEERNEYSMDAIISVCDNRALQPQKLDPLKGVKVWIEERLQSPSGKRVQAKISPSEPPID